MLDKYNEKRDFERTSAPPPGEDFVEAGPLTFVIQKHDLEGLLGSIESED